MLKTRHPFQGSDAGDAWRTWTVAGVGKDVWLSQTLKNVRKSTLAFYFEAVLFAMNGVVNIQLARIRWCLTERRKPYNNAANHIDHLIQAGS